MTDQTEIEKLTQERDKYKKFWQFTLKRKVEVHRDYINQCGLVWDLQEALSVIVANARLIPDPAMGGAADIFAVPLDDIEKAQTILAKALDKLS